MSKKKTIENLVESLKSSGKKNSEKSQKELINIYYIYNL